MYGALCSFCVCFYSNGGQGTFDNRHTGSLAERLAKMASKTDTGTNWMEITEKTGAFSIKLTRDYLSLLDTDAKS